MHVVTLTLGRVFDVQRFPAGDEDGPHTLFSFEADGVRHFALNVPGHPALEAGHRISFVLTKPGRWQTLAGWHNHTTGEQVLPASEPYLVGAALFGLSAVAAAVALQRADTAAQTVGTSLWLIISAVVAIGSLRAALRQETLGEQVRAMASEGTSVRPPA